jgi:hypothetical protein
MRNLLPLLLCTLIAMNVAAQQASYIDPAQAYNRLVIEKNNGTYMQVSNFKVIGSPYLFGDKSGGNIYSAAETAYNINLSYNFYNQEVLFYSSANPTSPLMKEPSSLDSFIIKKNPQVGLQQDILFVYGPTVLGTKDKYYYQVVSKGKNYNLYKRYSGELVIVTSNILQSELREFNLVVDYYYTDSTGKNPKKLKTTVPGLSKEFSSVVKGASSMLDNDLLTTKKEEELMKFFVVLNSK